VVVQKDQPIKVKYVRGSKLLITANHSFPQRKLRKTPNRMPGNGKAVIMKQTDRSSSPINKLLAMMRPRTAPLMTSCLTLIVAYLSLTVNGFQLQSDRRTASGLVWKHDTVDANRPGESPIRRKVDLPPVLQQIADERAEFHINLGRAMDTLRSDMPKILSRTPGM
jgi:hypothetical protein